jgi:O-antigen/teichoic acid export membrane protein
MRLVSVALSSVTGAVSSALVPIVALLLLAPTEYGLFSVPYLIYAFGVSLQYSVVSEAWARLRARTPDAVTWRSYTGALSMLAAVMALAGGVVFLLIARQPVAAALMCGAVLSAVYQSGIRYYRVATGAIRRVMLSDLAGIVAFVIGILAFSGLHDLGWIAGAWLLQAVAAVLVLGLPIPARGAGLITWTRTHHRVIRPLLLDSLLMDAGAIGTPFLLAGLMSPRSFGIYRAVSNVAMPVRLLVDPLRPMIGRMQVRRLFAMTTTALLITAGALLSAACYLVLVFIVPLFADLGTLTALVPYALPASLFVAGSLWGTVYYIVCRTRATHRRIMIGRIAQTVLVIILPIAGFAAWGLVGAIWGFSLSSLISSAVWATLACRGLRDE